MQYALIIHGGAGAQPGMDYTEQTAHMNALIREGQRQLIAGRDAISVVESMVADLEKSGLYVAGKGSAPNMDGVIELDASIMDGREQRAGAVAAISDVEHPIKAARHVMEDGKHVMMTGASARRFALSKGLRGIDNPDAYYTEHEKHGSANVRHQSRDSRRRRHGYTGAFCCRDINRRYFRQKRRAHW